MSDVRARRDAREQVEQGAWALTRLLEDMEGDRNRWRSLAVGWARDVVAGNEIDPKYAGHIIVVAEEEARNA